MPPPELEVVRWLVAGGRTDHTALYHHSAMQVELERGPITGGFRP